MVNGTPGIGIGIKKQHGTNSVAVAKAVKARLAGIQKTLPPDITIEVNFDSSVFIQDAIHETEFTLVLSILITSLVCFLFLGSWSSTFNVLLSIPTSVMGTFAVLYFMGFTLNFFTLLGLSLAIGIVVDDAIMVLENIVRHHEMGKSRVLASRDGAREITFAALAATIAVVAIFLPGGVHERDHRAVFLPVRHHDLGGGAAVADRGHHGHADALLAVHGRHARRLLALGGRASSTKLDRRTGRCWPFASTGADWCWRRRRRCFCSPWRWRGCCQRNFCRARTRTRS